MSDPADPDLDLDLDLDLEELKRALLGWARTGRDAVLQDQREGAEVYTMIGAERLDNVHRSIRTVLDDGIPGDLMECGVWRGGVPIFMRAALAAYDDASRSVWVADSFAGVPRPNVIAFPEDADWETLSELPFLAVDRAQVEANFTRFDLLDERVRFLAGWFSDTLPTAPVERLALLRLDGDLYESTFVALESLYGRVSPGGIVIIDDYAFAPCRLATDDFRRDHGVDEPLTAIDWTGVWWRKRS